MILHQFGYFQLYNYSMKKVKYLLAFGVISPHFKHSTFLELLEMKGFHSDNNTVTDYAR
jgi:hypothetical protein